MLFDKRGDTHLSRKSQGFAVVEAYGPPRVVSWGVGEAVRTPQGRRLVLGRVFSARTPRWRSLSRWPVPSLSRRSVPNA